MKEWIKILEEIEQQSSYKKKKDLLEIGINIYPELEKFLKMTFNSSTILNIDFKTIEKALSIDTSKIFKDIGEKLKWYLNSNAKNKSLLNIDNKKKSFDDFIVLYNDLLNKRGTLAKIELNNFFLNCDENDAKWYVRCLIKDLHSNVSIATVNKVLIKCDREPIKKFTLQLAVALGNDDIENKIEKLLKENNNELYCENKEDGVRMCIRNTNPLNIGVWEALSRNGKPILNVDNILYECKRIFGDTTIELDGELVADDFYSLSTTIKRKNDTGTIIPRTFKVFDIMNCDGDITDMSYITRRRVLNSLSNKSDIIDVVENYTFTIVEDIIEYFNQQVEKGEEGIIIKNNAPYTYKRENWYKLKPVHTLDLKIIGFEYAEDGKYSGQRSSIKISSQDEKLISSVGSGLKESDVELFNMGEESDWIGKIIEVKFDSITPINKEGVKSLRFPRFVRIRDDKDVADKV